MIPGTWPVRLQKFISGSDFVEKEALVVCESPVSLSVNGEIWLTFSCTPIQLEELAIGFLYNERLIQSYEEIASIRVCDDSTNIDVWIDHKMTRPAHWTRTSGCSGGITSILAQADFIPISRHYDAEKILENMEQLLNKQDLYHETGGLHCSALSDGDHICFTSEDIGRHNTLDKLSGQLLSKGGIFSDRIILTTGRISSEMLQKSSRMKAQVVVSRSSPTSLSIAQAEKARITLIGYARRNQMNVYTHSSRLIL